MPIVAVEVEIYCATCGAGLCNQSEFVHTRTRDIPSFRVEVCDRCVDAAVERGRVAGHSAGYDEGHAAGYDEATKED